jgi:hypothetical protein
MPPPIEGNFPKMPKNPDSDIVKNKPLIIAKKPGNKDNLLLITEKEKNPAIIYQSKVEIGEIPPKKPEKFFLNNSEQLPLITNGEQPTDKEQILLTRIKQLEKELAKVQAENNHLKLENKHLKTIIKQDQETENKILQISPFKGQQ